MAHHHYVLRLRGIPLHSPALWSGEVLEPNNSELNELNRRFALDLGVRSIIRVHLTRIQDSCGYGVPLYGLVEPRDTLLKWAERKGERGIVSSANAPRRASMVCSLSRSSIDRNDSSDQRELILPSSPEPAAR